MEEGGRRRMRKRTRGAALGNAANSPVFQEEKIGGMCSQNRRKLRSNQRRKNRINSLLTFSYFENYKANLW